MFKLESLFSKYQLFQIMEILETLIEDYLRLNQEEAKREVTTNKTKD